MTSALSDPASGHRNGRHTVVDYSFHTDWALNESVDPLEDIVTKLLMSWESIPAADTLNRRRRGWLGSIGSSRVDTMRNPSRFSRRSLLPNKT